MRAIRSASPVVSITTLAKMAWRPSLLSKMAPLTTLPSMIGATAQACSSRRTLASTTICMDKRLERLGIDRRRPRDDAVIGGRSLRPIGGAGCILRAPVGALRALDRVLGQTLHQLVGDATDDVPAGPVGHAVDPDDEAAGRKPAQVIVALDQQHVGAEPAGSDGRRRPGRTAADHQHVGLGEDGYLAGGLEVGLRRPRALLPARAAAEELDPLLGADACCSSCRAAGPSLKISDCVEEASAVFGALVVRHAVFLPCLQ